jgi:hypothetical protein
MEEYGYIFGFQGALITDGLQVSLALQFRGMGKNLI